MIERFRECVDNRHDYAREWKKRTGGKVVGYFCTYVPEEILYAAGTLPVRILGGHQPPDLVEPHIYGMFCPFCRDCLEQGLRGEYDYLDGIVIAQSCLHLRQTYWSWQKHIPTEYNYYLYMPHGVGNAAAYDYLRDELVSFKASVENWTGRSISDEDLDRAIEIYNSNRRLLRQVYEFRKRDCPSLTGLEAMEVVLSSQLSDKEEHTRVVEELLRELPERKLDREVGTRLAIVGSENDDRDFMRLVEQEMELPATFVIDDHCTGSRYFWNEVVPREDRLAAVAARYIDRPPCPSKDWPQRRRFPYLLSLVKEYDVQGAILMQQKFCDPHEFDIPALKNLFEDNDIPTCFLEFDVTVPAGQFQTRLEAFIETLTDFI